MNEVENFKDFFDAESWGKLQNAIAEITGMSILTVNYRGMPITSHNGCSEFCARVRNDQDLCGYCHKCDARGSLEGAIRTKPFMYKCHFSIVDIAIPIIVDGYYFGAIMAGQILLKDNDDEELEQILVIKKSIIEDALAKYKVYYDKIPYYTKEELEQKSNMLYHLCGFFASEILKKGSNSSSLSFDKEDTFYYPNLSNRIIMEGINYVYCKKDRAITLTEAARHCHVSAPYFSRLFTKEMGESFSSFVAKLKIAWAKEFLQNTDMTVNEISSTLGFSESGYFIKTFKKNTGKTPMNYRIQCRDYGMGNMIRVARA